MKKIISNLSVMIFVIGCVIMEITTWFIDSYVMFYIGIIRGIIRMCEQVAASGNTLILYSA